MSIPTLMMSLVHITGDAGLLRGELRPAGLFLNEVQGFMSEDDKQAVRDLDVLLSERLAAAALEAEGPDQVHGLLGGLLGGLPGDGTGSTGG